MRGLKGTEVIVGKSRTHAASTSVGARCARPARSWEPGQFRPGQKGVAARDKVPKCPRGHQGHPVGCSPPFRLHDDPSDAGDEFPSFSLQRDALRRQLDDVRQVSALGSPCLQLDQRDQPVASAVCAIHTGHQLSVATGPEGPLRVSERVVLQLPGHPRVRFCRASANNTCRSPGRYHAGNASGEKWPELNR